MTKTIYDLNDKNNILTLMTKTIYYLNDKKQYTTLMTKNNILP